MHVLGKVVYVNSDLEQLHGVSGLLRVILQMEKEALGRELD